MLIRSSRVVVPGVVRPASIVIEHGRIARIDAYDAVSPDAEVLDYGDLVVAPGLVDTHVHVNEPGRTDWEGFDTATRAAAAGGVTTIVDMPLNSVPATTTVEALEAKRAAARGQCHVDVAFWGGVVPGNRSALDCLVDAGVRGFKCFLVPSGVDEFPAVTETDLRQAMPILARRGVPLLVHAERGGAALPAPPPPSEYVTYLATRPPAMEVDAIRLMIRLAAEFGTRTHIVHVACAEAVQEIARAKTASVPITAETCPHYLTFAAEEIPDRATEFKCAPPIRESRHRAALWEGLRRGVLDLVATDHSPAPPALKCAGDFVRAWGGIASLELALSAVWTGRRPRPAADQLSTLEAQRSATARPEPSERVDLCSLARWMSEAPAALAGLTARKGRIAPGCDADLVVWDPDVERAIDASRLQQRHKLTPYANRPLRGAVHATLVRGVRVWNGDGLAHARSGQLI